MECRHIAPLQGIYPEALSALAYNSDVNVVMSEYFQSVRMTKHSKLKKSSEADPRTHVEPTNRFPSTGDR